MTHHRIEFALAMLEPGASLVVTNLPLSDQSTASCDRVIVTSELPEDPDRAEAETEG